MTGGSSASLIGGLVQTSEEMRMTNMSEYHSKCRRKRVLIVL